MYRTTDLYYAAFLCYAGEPTPGVEWVSGRATFVFGSNPPSLRPLKDAFYSGMAEVKVGDYVRCINRLKGLLRNPPVGFPPIGPT